MYFEELLPLDNLAVDDVSGGLQALLLLPVRGDKERPGAVKDVLAHLAVLFLLQKTYQNKTLPTVSDAKRAYRKLDHNLLLYIFLLEVQQHLQMLRDQPHFCEPKTKKQRTASDKCKIHFLLPNKSSN